MEFLKYKLFASTFPFINTLLIHYIINTLIHCYFPLFFFFFIYILAQLSLALLVLCLCSQWGEIWKAAWRVFPKPQSHNWTVSESSFHNLNALIYCMLLQLELQFNILENTLYLSSKIFRYSKVLLCC